MWDDVTGAGGFWVLGWKVTPYICLEGTMRIDILKSIWKYRKTILIAYP